MQRIMMALGLLLFAAAPAGAQQVSSIEIFDVGIYTTETTSSAKEASGISSKKVTNIRLAVATTHVPLQAHIEFGFRYRIKGTPDGASVQVRVVDLFPPPGLKPPGKAQPLLRDEVVYGKTVGATHYAS